VCDVWVYGFSQKRPTPTSQRATTKDQGGAADRMLPLSPLLLLLQMLQSRCHVQSAAGCCYGHSTMRQLRHRLQPRSVTTTWTCGYSTSKCRCWTPVLAFWMLMMLGHVAGTWLYFASPSLSVLHSVNLNPSPFIIGSIQLKFIQSRCIPNQFDKWS